MTYAYWYLFLAFLFPYLFATLAKFAAKDFDNSSPREFFDNLQGWRKRSHWVQLNSFETFPPFAAAIIIAHQLNATQQAIDTIALIFIIFRVLYGIFYISNKAALRSLSWVGSLACIFALFYICI